MNDYKIMVDLIDENNKLQDEVERLKKRVEELEDKHYIECGMIAHYDDELRTLQQQQPTPITEAELLDLFRE